MFLHSKRFLSRLTLLKAWCLYFHFYCFTNFYLFLVCVKFSIDYIFVFFFQNNLEFMVGILSFVSVGSHGLPFIQLFSNCNFLVTRKIFKYIPGMRQHLEKLQQNITLCALLDRWKSTSALSSATVSTDTQLKSRSHSTLSIGSTFASPNKR